MIKTLTAAFAAVSLLAVAACNNSAPSPKHVASKHGTASTVVFRTHTYVSSPGPVCKRTPTLEPCKPRWTLTVRTRSGKRSVVAVSKTVYAHCRLGASYPACARRSP